MKIDKTLVSSLAINFVLFLLLGGYLAINAGPAWVFMEVRSDHEDMAQLYMHNGTRGYEKFSQPYPLLAGVRRIAYRLPPYWHGSDLRLDPGSNGNQNGILSIDWYSGFLHWNQPLDQLRASAGSLVDGADGGERTASADAQIVVPAVSAVWRNVALATAYAPAPLLFVAVGFLAWRRRIPPTTVATIYLAAIAATYLYFCLRFGANLPVFDDWRYVIPSNMSLLQGNWQWLLATGNDTYFLTGQVIDFIVLQLSGFNFLPLRIVALGLLLLNIWWVRGIVLRTSPEKGAGAAIAISLCAWSFVAGRLWGGSTMAYHQALPTIFSSLMMLHLIGPSGQFRQKYSALLLILAAAASGLAYISGGVMVMALGASTLFIGFFSAPPTHRKVLLGTGSLLLVAGAILLGIQFAMVDHYQGSLLQHNHAVDSVYPNDRRFWLSFFAQFGLAFGYSGTSVLLDAALAVLAITPAVILAIRLLTGYGDKRSDRPGLLLVILYSGVAATLYAGIVAFGRAGFIDPLAAPEMIAAVAKGRLLFWPITALIPFFFLSWMELTRRWNRTHVFTVLVGGMFLWPKAPMAFDLITSFDFMASKSINGAYCVANAMARNAPTIACPDAAGDARDLSGAIRQLREKETHLYEQLEAFGPNSDSPSD